MDKRSGLMRIFAGRVRVVLIFLLDLCYVFASLLLLSLGLTAFPSVLLGHYGILAVTSDIAPMPLMMMSGGVLLLGTGLSLCIIPVCKASFGVFVRISKENDICRRRMLEAGSVSDGDTDSDEER